ncbi:hypothetical protein CRG98_024339 [Punica granatum]|uniref:Lipoxygenase n=1 Tax=Punica granatum TaxID=22663 RepID=A0A2I0JH55_PUNGR|nr:hypothetical protein CRG98_024339 [Punica granatum]
MSINSHIINGEVVILASHGQAGPGKSASIRLYSATELDPKTSRGKLSKEVRLKHGRSKKDKGLKTVTYRVKIRVDTEFGIPGALVINNKHKNKFFLQSASFQVPSGRTIHFDCNSWVYPVKKTNADRIFFSNMSYLPNQTPEALEELRREELSCLRGDGTGKRKEWDRIYDYDYYNDLGNPDRGEEHVRPVLGGNASYPYPRRLRTGRPPSENDPSYESKPGMMSLNIFVPPDEQFNPRKLPALLSNSIQSAVHFLVPEARSLLRDDSDSFDSFDEIRGLFARKENRKPASDEQPKKKTSHRKKQGLTKFPLPQIIAEDEWAWKSDVEFARQMLAGANPVRIQCLQEFPPLSRSGALKDSTLKPVAIELSLPGTPYGMEFNRVFLPALGSRGDQEAALWQLAKAHVSANDCAYHHLISHWLHTHAVVEPFIIATRRQLSAMHPIHRLLDPHFKDTIHINALARLILMNSGGMLETILFTKKVSMELSSMLYKEWRFDEQGLPSDLLKRGMAIDDPSSPAGVQLLFEDYPYAADGLEIWTALKTWVTDFCSIFYRDDSSVQSDEELQAWWSEIRNVGHGDKKDETWWYDMRTLTELIEAITTLIWITSALHASVASGQYTYAGFPPNRPGLCRRFVPKEGTFEFGQFLRETDRYYLELLPGRSDMTLMVALMEVLSRHTSHEVYLGQRSLPEWTDNGVILQKFANFNGNLRQIEERILERNKDPNLKNRFGPAKIPYELLYPNASNAERAPGNAGKGIPNSISI